MERAVAGRKLPRSLAAGALTAGLGAEIDYDFLFLRRVIHDIDLHDRAHPEDTGVAVEADHARVIVRGMDPF